MFQATSDPSHPKCTRQTMGKDVINTVVARRNPTADGIRRPFLRLNVARDGTVWPVNKPPTRLSAASGAFLSAAASSLIIVGGELDFFAWRRLL